MERQINQVIHMVIFLSILMFPSFTSATEPDGNQTIVHEVKIGLLAHDVDNLWSGSKRESGEDINFEAVFSSVVGFLGGDIHPVLGASINTQGYTSKLYLDGVWRFYVTNNLYGAVGVGVTVHNGEKHLVDADMKALGSQILFHLPLEIGYTFYPQFTLSIYFDHMSNAELSDENEGLDTLGLRLGYSF